MAKERSGELVLVWCENYLNKVETGQDPFINPIARWSYVTRRISGFSEHGLAKKQEQV